MAAAREERDDEVATLKPPTFSGLEADWTEWAFIFKACACAKLENGEALLATAENTAGRNVSLEAIAGRSAQAAQEAKKLFYMLVMTVKGPGQAILRSVEVNNGVEAWCGLHKRYEPATAMRAQSIMQGVLSVPVFPNTLAEFEEKHGEWLADIRRYETATWGAVQRGCQEDSVLAEGPEGHPNDVADAE